MLRLLTQWDPILYVDLHVTDGAQFEHDVSYNVAPTLPAIPTLRRAAGALRDELMQRTRDAGSLPLDFYPSFVRDDDPASGFAVGVGAAALLDRNTGPRAIASACSSRRIRGRTTRRACASRATRSSR